MSDGNQDLRRLLPLLEMAYGVEQLKMSKVLARIRELHNQLKALDRPESSSVTDFDPAILAGADLRWEQWAQDRKVLINQELALALRDREAAKQCLIKALSKLEAAKQVQIRNQAEQDQTKERRASW